MKTMIAQTRAATLASALLFAGFAAAQPAPVEKPDEEQPQAATEPQDRHPDTLGANPTVVISLAPPLLAPAASAEERSASAQRLADESRIAPLRAALAGNAGEDAAAAARRAIAAHGGGELLALLTDAAVTGSNPTAAGLCVAALEDAASRDALRELVRILQAGTQAQNTTLAIAAARAIERSTGRACDPSSPSAWLEWWAEVEWLPETEWQTHLAKGFQQSWHEAVAEREAYALRTETLYRRLFSELPPEGRTALLGEMLTSSRRSVRLVGLELIERSLLNGRPVDPTLATPTAEALKDPSSEVRQLAARSLTRFAPGETSGPALEALKLEHNATTAATLLDLVSSGDPGAAASELAERWLDAPGPAVDAAARLISRAISNNKSPGHEFQVRVRLQTRTLIQQSQTPAIIRLLSIIGTEEDLPRLGSIIQTGDSTAISSAVRALISMPGGYGQLARLTSTLPELRAVIADNVSRHATDLAAYRFILQIDSMPIDARQIALTRLWANLPPESLLSAARETASPNLRTAMLRDRLVNDGTELPRATRRGLILLYAESLALSASPENVLAALGMLDREDQPTHGSELAAIAIRRLHESQAEIPDPGICSPELWATALRRLADTVPAAAAHFFADEGLRAHLQTDTNAEHITLAALQTLSQLGSATENSDSDPE